MKTILQIDGWELLSHQLGARKKRPLIGKKYHEVWN
jgi:hypothetical protein